MKILDNVIAFLKSAYTKLVNINDTPQKISLGMGLGVFLGIFPGVGPIAAAVLSAALRVNIAAALLGSLLTNTWLSVAIFIPAVKAGAAMAGTDWQTVKENWAAFTATHNWFELFKSSALEIAAPVAAGYFLVSLSLGIIAYLMTLAVIKGTRYERKDPDRRG